MIKTITFIPIFMSLGKSKANFFFSTYSETNYLFLTFYEANFLFSVKWKTNYLYPKSSRPPPPLSNGASLTIHVDYIKTVVHNVGLGL